MARLSVTAAHTHTLDPQHQDVHHRKKTHTQPTVSRKCFKSENESEQTRTKRTEEQETETAIMKQCGRNWICYTDRVQRKCDMKWDERQSECGGSDRRSIQACCRRLVGGQNYKHTSVKFCFPLSHFAFLSAWGRNMFCITSPQIGAVNILIRRIFMARLMVNTSSSGM